jgi:uncharacterized membrane protein
LLHVIITKSRKQHRKQLYLAIGAVGIAVLVAILVAQRFTLFGEIIVSVYEDFYVQDLSENHPDILDAALTVDDAMLNLAPKLKDIMKGAFENKDNTSPSPRHYTSELSVFDYNSIKALSQENPLAAERFSKSDDIVVKYGNFYYGISIIRR